MMKSCFLIFILLILLSFGLSSNFGCYAHNESDRIGLNDEFMITGFNSSVKIILRNDFSFSNTSFARGCTGGYAVQIVTGTYSINDSKVVFMPEKIMKSHSAFELFTQNLVFEDTLDYYDSDSTKIQKEYWLVSVEKVRFLISESSQGTLDECFYKSSNFISLANLYNSREELSACEYLLANKDTIMNFRNLDVSKEIPMSWRGFFLEEPIQAKIQSVKIIKDEMSALVQSCKLDKGEVSGVKVGMKFFENSISSDFIEISEVFENYSKGLYSSDKKIKKGVLVSTENRNSGQ